MYFSEQSDDGQFHLCGRIYVENANGQLYVMQKKGHFVAKLNLLGFSAKKKILQVPWNQLINAIQCKKKSRSFRVKLSLLCSPNSLFLHGWYLQSVLFEKWQEKNWWIECWVKWFTKFTSLVLQLFLFQLDTYNTLYSSCM